MIIKATVYLIAFLIFLKLLWNIALPYAASRNYAEWMRVGGKKPSGVSFDIVTEIILLALLCLLYYFSDDAIYGLSTFAIFIIGIALIATSYAITILVGAICTFFYKKI